MSKINKIASKSFKRIFKTYKNDFNTLSKKYDENMQLFGNYLDDETKEKFDTKLESYRNKKYKPSRLKSRIVAFATAVGVMAGYSACSKSNNDSKEEQETTTSITQIDNKKIEEVKNEKTVVNSKYAYDYKDFDVVSTNLAKLGDTNTLVLNQWLAGSKNISEDSELMLKFYIAANYNTLYEPNSIYSSIVQKYTATDLYTSFFQVLDDLQVKAVFATNDEDIHLSKYFISNTDREYVESLEKLLVSYNNAKKDEKSTYRKKITKWVNENVVRQDYGNVSKSAVIVSYRLIQNARLTNAVKNVKELDNIKSLEELEKVSDDLKTTTDYLVTKFIDSKEISCNGYDEKSSTKPVLSDDSIDFINGVKEFHDTLFNQKSSEMTVEKLVEMINSKRINKVKKIEVKSDEKIKDEYLKELEKVDPTNPALVTGTNNGEEIIYVTEKEKTEIRKETEKEIKESKTIKNSNGKTLATGKEVDTYDTTAYQNGYNAGSIKGAEDGAYGRAKNSTTTGKNEYVEGYKLGYDQSYDEAKAVYDAAVAQNNNPKQGYEKVQEIEEPKVKEGTKVTESKVKTSGGDTKKTETKAEVKTETKAETKAETKTETKAEVKTETKVETNQDSGMEFISGFTVDEKTGKVMYDGSEIELTKEDAEWIATIYGSDSSKSSVKSYTK